MLVEKNERSCYSLLMAIAATTDKGSATREMILDRAYVLASRKGLEGLSIGELAAAAKMSKSGVFAHFGSREELQLAVLEFGAQRFGERVFVPALREKRGLPRLRAIVHGWFDWVRENRYGCLLMGAVNEYDARPGPQRDRVVALMELWRSECAKAVALAVDARELRADTDARQFAFEVFGISLALHQDTRLFDPKLARTQAERAFERLIAAHSR
ncbi:MAG: TetR/AcrR family transcriptional regulator [Proteobacteria bacterium]|nr:TetR/AcrR family transcriptional regulator [Pseudomonadota bacterium]MBS0568697.1 TetR/AcrR family transcriptional regulator [Pseudomonadota bacterium]